MKRIFSFMATYINQASIKFRQTARIFAAMCSETGTAAMTELSESAQAVNSIYICQSVNDEANLQRIFLENSSKDAPSGVLCFIASLSVNSGKKFGRYIPCDVVPVEYRSFKRNNVGINCSNRFNQIIQTLI